MINNIVYRGLSTCTILFIYLYLFTVIYIVHFSYFNAQMRCTGHTGQPSVREIDAHTMYNQWATTPGRSLNYPRPKSITHLGKFSDGVCVALQLFLVILVSDQWLRVLIPYSYRQAPWDLLYAWGWLSRYTWDQHFTWYPSHRRHSLQCWKPGFYTLQFW